MQIQMPTETSIHTTAQPPLWSWKSWQGKPFLSCSLLPQPHGFFTRHFYPLGPEELVHAILPLSEAESVPRLTLPSVHRVKQVHSGDVLTPTEADQAMTEGLPRLEDGSVAAFPLADGLATERAGQAVWACSADCTPALLCDVMTGQAAAVHAGWRGTAVKILPAAVARLQAQGSELSNIRVALGPAIDGSVYQVGLDVAARIGASVVAEEGLPEAVLIENLMALKNPPLLSDSQPERVRLDVRRINQMQLEQLGVGVEQIAIAPHCTYQTPDHFFSYRRTGERHVQWSGIVSV
jgi:polyphenol oxidase